MTSVEAGSILVVGEPYPFKELRGINLSAPERYTRPRTYEGSAVIDGFKDFNGRR
jgi:hypothetical protein